MSGLDDLLGSMTQSGGGGGGSAGGMGDLLGGLLGGGSGGGGGGGGLQDVLGGLLGGGGGGKGMNLGAMAVALAPMLGKFLKGGGLSQMMGNAQAAGLTDQADSWVSTGENKPIDGQQARAMVGDDAVKHLAQEAGISEDEAAEVLAKVVPGVVNGVTPNGQLPSDDELDNLVSKFGG